MADSGHAMKVMTKPNREAWRGVQIEERQRYIANELVVAHPDLVLALREIARIARRSRMEQKGYAMLVIAGSGQGKSFLTRYLAKRYPRRDDGEASKVPVLAFSVPASATGRLMGVAALGALGDPRANVGDSETVRCRLLALMAAVEVEIVLIDNVQDIPEKRREGGIKQVGNWIRDLIDGSKVLVVLLGTPAALLVTSLNPQLRRRAVKQLFIRYFDIEPISAFSRFMRLLDELDKQLPLAEPSALSKPDLARKVYFATYGVMDYLLGLVSEAVDCAVTAGREHLEMDDLAEAFSRLFRDAASETNPFRTGGPQRALDHPGEPFFKWFDSSNPRFPLSTNKSESDGGLDTA